MEKQVIESLESLENITPQITHQLQELIERNAAIEPVGLYYRHPEAEATLHYFVDKGCRGGWDETKDVRLKDQPYQVKAITPARYRRNELELKLQSEESRFDNPVVRLSTSTGISGQFFISPEYQQRKEAPSAFTETIRARLDDAPVFRLENVVNALPVNARLKASARDPLAYPISSMRESDRNYYYDVLSNKPVRSLTAVRSQDGDFITIMTDGVGGAEFRDIPLEAVAFETEEVSGRTAEKVFQQRITSCVQWLLSTLEHDPRNHELHQQATSKANQLLYGLESDQQAVYLPFAHERMYRKTGSLLLAKVVGVDSLDAPALSQLTDFADLRRPYTYAHDILTDNGAAWVVDRTAKLATPLLQDTFDVINPTNHSAQNRDYVHINELRKNS